MEQILNREITDTYFYSDFYIPWCDYNAYVPYDIKILRKLGDTIYDVEHYTYNDSDLNTSDELYIKSIERTDIRRKSCINQNMILFYKNYFKRKNEKN